MSALQLLEAIGSVDDDLLQKAREPQKSHRRIWMTVSAAVACLCVIAGAAAWGLRGDSVLNDGTLELTGDDVTQSVGRTDESIHEGDYTSDSSAALDSSASVNSGSSNSSDGQEHKNESTLASIEKINVSITQWNSNGFSAVVCDEESAFDYGTRVNVVLTETTDCKMPVDNAGNYVPFDMTVSNTGVGAEVSVEFLTMGVEPELVTVYAETVISNVIPVYTTGKEND